MLTAFAGSFRFAIRCDREYPIELVISLDVRENRPWGNHFDSNVIRKQLKLGIRVEYIPSPFGLISGRWAVYNVLLFLFVYSTR